MPTLNITQETLDNLIGLTRMAKRHYKNVGMPIAAERAAETLQILEEFDRAEMKAGGVCCPACERGFHDSVESRLHHSKMRCDCACNNDAPNRMMGGGNL